MIAVGGRVVGVVGGTGPVDADGGDGDEDEENSTRGVGGGKAGGCENPPIPPPTLPPSPLALAERELSGRLGGQPAPCPTDAICRAYGSCEPTREVPATDEPYPIAPPSNHELVRGNR